MTPEEFKLIATIITILLSLCTIEALIILWMTINRMRKESDKEIAKIIEESNPK